MLNKLYSLVTPLFMLGLLMSPVAVAGVTVPPTQVPLPATLILLVTGLLALGFHQRK
ncbi:MAG: PEP-CTERM sorting domain-containing protein [Motiliproteus sp.]